MPFCLPAPDSYFPKEIVWNFVKSNSPEALKLQVSLMSCTDKSSLSDFSFVNQLAAGGCSDFLHMWTEGPEVRKPGGGFLVTLETKCSKTVAFLWFLARAQLFSTQGLCTVCLPSRIPDLPPFPHNSPRLIARSQIKCHLLREHILDWCPWSSPQATLINST